MPPGSFYKPKFFDFMKEEFQACREGVGIIDMSSFSKIEIKVISLNKKMFLTSHNFDKKKLLFSTVSWFGSG